MKRNLIYAALSLCLLLAGCDGTQEQPEPAPTSPSDLVVAEPAPAEEEVSAPVEESPAEVEEPVEAEPPFQFRSGIWLAKNDVGYTAYYQFWDDQPYAMSCELDYGVIQGFVYDGTGNDLVFTLGSFSGHGGLHHDVLGHFPYESLPSVNSSFPARVEVISEDEFILHWEHTLPETLTFVQEWEATLEDFPFHCNAELGQLALDYYSVNSGVPFEEIVGMQLGVMTNVDNTVTIQLYENLGDHNSTAAWYVVDRFTATGIDLTSGEEVNLLPQEPEVIPEEALPEEPLPEELPETEDILETEELPGEIYAET